MVDPITKHFNPLYYNLTTSQYLLNPKLVSVPILFHCYYVYDMLLKFFLDFQDILFSGSTSQLIHTTLVFHLFF